MYFSGRLQGDIGVVEVQPAPKAEIDDKSDTDDSEDEQVVPNIFTPNPDGDGCFPGGERANKGPETEETETTSLSIRYLGPPDY